jgi:hypothetical protein
MSWGYWGIVLGVAVMVLVLFGSLEIMIWRKLFPFRSAERRGCNT